MGTRRFERLERERDPKVTPENEVRVSSVESRFRGEAPTGAGEAPDRSGAAGVAYWVNENLRLTGDNRISKRHPGVIIHRTGVTRDGPLVAQDIEVVLDAGAYCTLSPVVLSRSGIHAGGPYHCPNVRIRARAMATNTPPNGAFRGFGAPQSAFPQKSGI